eukprot:g15640.t1
MTNDIFNWSSGSCSICSYCLFVKEIFFFPGFCPLGWRKNIISGTVWFTWGIETDHRSAKGRFAVVFRRIIPTQHRFYLSIGFLERKCVTSAWSVPVPVSPVLRAERDTKTPAPLVVGFLPLPGFVLPRAFSTLVLGKNLIYEVRQPVKLVWVRAIADQSVGVFIEVFAE